MSFFRFGPRVAKRQRMLLSKVRRDSLRKQSWDRSVQASPWLPTMLLAASLTVGTAPAQVLAKDFKVTNIHFETNASACDMGVQIAFDTEGITEGSVQNPNGTRVYSFHSAGGMKAIGGQTEGFLEGVEPQITELLSALGCEPSDEEEEISLAQLFGAWPSGRYTFTGLRKGATLEGQDRLTHNIPAGPKIIAPANGSVLPDGPILIRWKAVSNPILPNLGPVHIVGYHVVVVEAEGEALPQFDVDLPPSETKLQVPAQYLKPDTIYQFEVLSTEESGNQTITEGFFCTTGITNCVLE